MLIFLDFSYYRYLYNFSKDSGLSELSWNDRSNPHVNIVCLGISFLGPDSSDPADVREAGMGRKIFCDRCGRELEVSEVVQLLGHDLCPACCKETVGSK